MSNQNDMFMCSCGFKCIEIQLAKTEGKCPKCGKRAPKTIANKYTDEVLK